jgi:hypothetical protein
MVPVDEETWKSIISLFEIYKSKMFKSTPWKRLTFNLPPKKTHSHAFASLVQGAFDEEYKPMPYSCQDFSNCIQEIVDGIPCPPPGRVFPADLIQIYFASYTVMIQSSMMGKTRFLLTPIKENESLRVFIVYFTMKSNIGEVGHELLDMVLSSLATSYLKESANFLQEIYEKILTLLRNQDGTLKEEFSDKGGYFSDDLWSKAKYLNPTPFNEGLFCPVETENGRKRGKRIVIVFAIDEAHHLFDEKFVDHQRFGLTFAPISSPSNPALSEASLNRYF